MAGMLPGVECARRRRVDTPGASASSRRSSFCLYTSNRESSHFSISSSVKSIINHTNEEQKLGEVARQAKERLDERLRTHGKSKSKRHGTTKILKGAEGKSMAVGELQTEVYGFKRNGSA